MSPEQWSATASVVQAGAAIVSLVAVIILGVKQNSMVKNQQTQEEKKETRIKTAVSFIIRDRMDLFAYCLERVTGQQDLGAFQRVKINFDIPHELIVANLEETMARDLYVNLGALRELQSILDRNNFREEEMVLHCATTVKHTLELKSQLEQYLQTLNKK